MNDYTNQDVQKQILVDYMHLMIVLEEWDALTEVSELMCHFPQQPSFLRRHDEDLSAV